MTTYTKTAAGNLFAYDTAAGWVLVPHLTRRDRIAALWRRLTRRGTVDVAARLRHPSSR